MKNNEEWRDIKGYKGLYKINEKGQIISYPHKFYDVWGNERKTEIKKLKATFRSETNSYIYGLTDKNHKTKQHYMHILIAETFEREEKFIDLPNEIWQESFDDLEVSNKGRIRKLYKNYSKENMTFSNYKLIKTSDNGHGYLALNCKGRTKYAHRLVATAFITNPRNLPEVNHIDGNKKNNNVENLEWVTRKRNAEHALEIGLMPRPIETNITKLTKEEVKEIKTKFLEGVPTSELEREYEVGKHAVLKIAKGITFKEETADIPNFDGDMKLRRILTRKTSSRNTSGHTGITFNKKTKKWRARINFNGKSILNEEFENIERAIECREEMIKKLRIAY